MIIPTPQGFPSPGLPSGQVAEALEDPHPLVTEAEEALRAAVPDRTGILCAKEAGALDITVSEASLDRALLIADALLKALESRGFPVSAGQGAFAKTEVVVLDGTLAFSLVERAKRVPCEPTFYQPLDWGPPRRSLLSPDHELVPSGRLSLEIEGGSRRGGRRRWKDAEAERMEDCLNRFIVGLIKRSVRESKWDREERRLSRIGAEKKRKERERREQREAAERRAAQLKENAEAWHRSQKVRAYIEAVRRSAIAEHGEIVPGSETEAWLEWATRQADEMDP